MNLHLLKYTMQPYEIKIGEDYLEGSIFLKISKIV